MSKKYYSIITLFLLAFCLVLTGCTSNNDTQQNINATTNNTYQSEKSGVTVPLENQTSDENKKEEENKKEKVEKDKNTRSDTKTSKTKTSTKETTLASFSTRIHSQDSERQNNIKITCNALNNTTVRTGKTFSFNSVVGKSTSSKGYEKADVFDNGKKKKGLGGGNCQVSTTLYNAVLKVSGLKVTERHKHSNDVPYIQKGKDAAVAYGSYDFKFINNTKNTIKIKASRTKQKVTIRIVKLY